MIKKSKINCGQNLQYTLYCLCSPFKGCKKQRRMERSIGNISVDMRSYRTKQRVDLDNGNQELVNTWD